MIRTKDKEVLFVIFLLLGLGVLQVLSSSYIFSLERYGDGFLFFKKQLIFAAVGSVALFVGMNLSDRVLKILTFCLVPIAILGIYCTLIPGVGIKVGGAKRWLPLLLGLRFEPAELLKIAVPLSLPLVFTSHKKSPFGKWRWHVFGSASLLAAVGLLLQPDFGSLFILTLVIFGVAFFTGLEWKFILGAGAFAAVSIYGLIATSSYRMSRIMAFIDPWSDPSGKGFQGIQSMLTFATGGFFGAGVGNSQGKLLFLPEAHTDFTLAVFGEEFGFIGYTFLMSLYGYLVLRGLQTANRAPRYDLQIMALALTLSFTSSVVINMGVVLGLLPTKGLTLAFMSYGGSSLVCNAFLLGVLINIQRKCRQ